MKLCDTEIVTFTEGGRSRFVANGALTEQEDGFTAAYFAEGDRVRLVLSGRSLVMQRQGNNGLHVKFSPGETGVMTLGIAEGTGSVPVSTEVCTVRRAKEGWRIALRYRLLFADVRIFRVNIAVSIISEEQ